MATFDERLAKLRDYQRIGVEFLVSEDGALLADEMGTGKTVQTACAIETLRRRRELGRALVIVPASLKLNWYRELREWASGSSVRLVEGNAAARESFYRLPFDVIIASYEQIRADFGGAEPLPHEFGLVVLDEAQRVKNAASSVTVGVARITRQRTWALSGTPLENRVGEFQTIIKLVRPGIQVGASREEVLDAIRGHFLRRKKTDVLAELPPIIEQNQVLELTAAQRSRYDRVWDTRQKFVGGDESQLFALLTELKQIANFDPETNQSSKLQALNEIVDDVRSEGGKLLVFSQYVETLRWLEPRMRGQSKIFEGSLSQEERDTQLKWFADTGPGDSLLISLRAGGVGLNLPEATHVVLFDRWWNPQLEDQAINRAHRFGRKEPLVVTQFVTRDTVEERVVELLHEKRDLFDEYVEGAAKAARGTTSRLKLILGLD